MQKTRILQVVGGMNRGGAETFLMNVLRNMDRSRFEFIFLCYGTEAFDYESEIARLGGKIVRISNPSAKNFIRHLVEIRSVIKKNHINVLHAHTFYNSALSLLVGRLSGVNIRIVHSHNTFSEYDPNIFKLLYFKLSKLIIRKCATKRVACEVDAGKAFFGNAKFEVIKNGINIEDFIFNETVRSAVRKELGIASKTKVLLSVARFEEVKNHRYLIEVFWEYHKLDSDSILLLVGGGILEEQVKMLVESKDIQSSVKFLGKRSDVNMLMSASDVFLMPSLFEGLPVVLVEAQASSLPAIVSDNVDERVALTDTISFASLKTGAVGWAENIERVIRKKRSTTTHKKMLDSDYNMPTSVKKIERLYN